MLCFNVTDKDLAPAVEFKNVSNFKNAVKFHSLHKSVSKRVVLITAQRYNPITHTIAYNETRVYCEFRFGAAARTRENTGDLI